MQQEQVFYMKLTKKQKASNGFLVKIIEWMEDLHY